MNITKKYISDFEDKSLFAVCLWSAFLNNTPIVALMIPIITSWSRVIKLPIAKFMIPLSYVSELGGVCTLIGTSTNLVIKGAYLTISLAQGQTCC